MTIDRSEAQARLTELRKALAEVTAEGEQIIAAVQGAGTKADPLQISDEHRKAMADVNARRKELRETIALYEGSLKDRDYLTAPAAAPEMWTSTVAAQPFGGKSIGQAFVESPAFKEMLAAGRHTMSAPFQVPGDITGYGRWQKDVYSGLATGLSPARREAPVVFAQRRTRVRDLFPARSISESVIEYLRVTGFSNNASVVPERSGSNFGAKPQTTLAFTDASATAKTIAHWEVASRSALADNSYLQGLIEDTLLYGLLLQEDYQVLQGTGTGSDLTGILNAGIGSYSQATVSTDNKADAIRRAMTAVMLAYYEPTGVVLHPNDWEDIELTKSAGSEKTYLFLASVQQGAEPRLFRLPVVETPAMPEGTALVGAFGLGAQLWDREQSTIRIAEQHGDLFVRNAVVILAEERLALTVPRPESFVKVTFS